MCMEPGHALTDWWVKIPNRRAYHAYSGATGMRQIPTNVVWSGYFSPKSGTPPNRRSVGGGWRQSACDEKARTRALCGVGQLRQRFPCRRRWGFFDKETLNGDNTRSCLAPFPPAVPLVLQPREGGEWEEYGISMQIHQAVAALRRFTATQLPPAFR